MIDFFHIHKIRRSLHLFPLEQTPLITIAPALDIIRSRPGDVAHSEYAGIAKQAQYVLFAAILTEAGANAYYAFPPRWGRLQSPKFHLASYRMQEYGRLSIIVPLLFRTWLEEKWINPNYLKAAENSLLQHGGKTNNH